MAQIHRLPFVLALYSLFSELICYLICHGFKDDQIILFMLGHNYQVSIKDPNQNSSLRMSGSSLQSTSGQYAEIKF